MSGGTFEYNQRRIADIYEKLKGIIHPDDEIKIFDEYDDDDDDDWYIESYKELPEEVKREFEKGLEIIGLAYIYTQRIDWLLADDDGEESFLKRLKEDINNFYKIGKI